jgi:hypothetical protein
MYVMKSHRWQLGHVLTTHCCGRTRAAHSGHVFICGQHGKPAHYTAVKQNSEPL